MRIFTCILLILAAVPGIVTGADLPWLSPNRYRTLMTVDPRGLTRSNSPVSAQVDFAALLQSAGGAGTFDKNTIEVVAYTAAGEPVTFDGSRAGYEKYLLPWRIDPLWKSNGVTLNFVMPTHQQTQYAVYYDTVESRHGKPQRYPGLVGDGDRFVVGYQRREVNACGYDTWCDLDGDGDLDLFKGGTEPFIHCYENKGRRFEYAGRLTSGGNALELPKDGNIRTWATIEFCDWDRDGDQDLFMHSPTGTNKNDTNCLWRYENITAPGGPLTFAPPLRLLTVSERLITSGVTFVDWDNDGKTDLLGNSNGFVNLYRNVGDNSRVSDIRVADPVYIQANGVPIELMNPKVECKDIDGDGDLDMFVGTEEGRIYFFENVGTRAEPVFTMGRILAFHEFMDARARAGVADFDGDSLLDFVPGRYWERTQWGEQPRVYGRMYKNVGTPTAPRFEPRDASNGAPCTEAFQIADAVRQNSVRVVDWDNDGKPDLIAPDTDGWVWFFRNTINRRFPVFADGQKILAAGQPLRVYGEDRVWYAENPDFVDECRAAGYARVDICDWNNDGKKDLLVADGRAWLWLYRNIGTDANPVLDAGTRVMANGKPIDGTSRASVLVCDWNNDGKKDLIFAMANSQGGYSAYYDWPHQSANFSNDGGFLFYKNTGDDANPSFGTPTWLTVGGSIIKYSSRPNLGSFVDWDGDGKKDFIGAEFEHAVHFYRNTGSGAPNTEPTLDAGVRIVWPSAFQMISGADAVDWDGDGDIDIVTGQGHGGSGLRFYERDYLNDQANEKIRGINTWPVVTFGATQREYVRADFDHDDDVDQVDWGYLQTCLEDEGLAYHSGCAAADLDDDGDVDYLDMCIFIECMAGPDVFPNCAS